MHALRWPTAAAAWVELATNFPAVACVWAAGVLVNLRSVLGKVGLAQAATGQKSSLLSHDKAEKVALTPSPNMEPAFDPE